jgi:hypothetical protein
VGIGFGGLDLWGFLVPLGIWISGPLEVTEGPFEAPMVAPACKAPSSDGCESDPSLDPTSSRPTAKTSRKAVPSTASRRTQ